MVKAVEALQPCKKSALLRGTPRNWSLLKLALTKVCSKGFQKVRLRWRSPIRRVMGFSCHDSAGFKPGLCYFFLYIRFPGPYFLGFVNWCYREKWETSKYGPLKTHQLVSFGTLHLVGHFSNEKWLIFPLLPLHFSDGTGLISASSWT